ncbi:hypothetical protein EWH99_12460 [Sporolactobacillus sp. THM7-7]|nr:hypothetical protein EWH99_12460 [Sporolactobacillus sp. THM7-7]
MSKYMILTNKQAYQTELTNEGLKPVETYDFYFFGQVKAKYTIVKVLDPSVKIKIYENHDGQKKYVNEIRMKFFDQFDSVEDAREELFEIAMSSEDDDLSKQSKLVKTETAG